MSLTFTTRNGQQWTAAFRDATEQAAADELGIRLADLATLLPEQLLARFRDAPNEFGSLLWLAVYDQVRDRGIVPARWADLFAAPYMAAAASALLRAIAARHPRSKLARRLRLAGKHI